MANKSLDHILQPVRVTDDQLQIHAEIKLAQERVKLGIQTKKINVLEDEINDLKLKNNQLKQEVQKLGFGSQKSQIKKLEKKIDKFTGYIKELELRDNLDYQLDKRYPKENSTIKKCLKKLDEYLQSKIIAENPQNV